MSQVRHRVVQYRDFTVAGGDGRLGIRICMYWMGEERKIVYVGIREVSEILSGMI